MLKMRAGMKFKCEPCNLTFEAFINETLSEGRLCPKCGYPGNPLGSPARGQYHFKKLMAADQVNRRSFVCRSLTSLGPEKLADIR